MGYLQKQANALFSSYTVVSGTGNKLQILTI